MQPCQLNLWGGVECTVNRVGDRWFDQLERTGHARRADDIERFARLGITGFRQPIIWERLQPDCRKRIDWSWADDRMNRLWSLGIRPIVGLLHHGSGPAFTSLVDRDFPEKLAGYAAEVAHRYPWACDYTPVNEPMTTARFSGLYGHWYPHGHDDATFCRTLVNQCRGAIMAMAAVREVNPDAQLVQTEDLGYVHSRAALRYQAAFENQRRWLSWDLLCGMVDDQHPMANYLLESGIDKLELDWFVANACPPDVLGINYYVTSERFLDDRIQHYSLEKIGGNGRDRYVDTEAVRVLPGGVSGVGRMIRQAWWRYRLPIALTEVSLACSSEEQVRWLLRAYEAALAAQAHGIDVRAVTSWALLGSYDWNCLVTSENGHYEPGAFELRDDEPRPTKLAAVIRRLARGRQCRHPLLHAPGWWTREDRLLAHAIDETQEARSA